MREKEEGKGKEGPIFVCEERERKREIRVGSIGDSITLCVILYHQIFYFLFSSFLFFSPMKSVIINIEINSHN